MKKDLQDQSKFEKYIHQELNGVEDTPDPGTWEGISTIQRQRNVWLRAKYVATASAPFALALVLVLGGWLGYRQMSGNGAPSAPAQPTLQAMEVPALQTANVPIDAISATAAAKRTNHFANFKGFPSWNKRNTMPAARVRFLAEDGLDYESVETGNHIHIPANALTDASGNRISGEVEMLFREYRGLAEMLAGGMPMHYSDERGAFDFNSGGMFEVRVAQMGNALYMADGQNYEVGFAPTHALENASLYYFDEKKDAWACAAVEAFGNTDAPLGADQKALPPVVNETVAARNNQAGAAFAGSECVPGLPGFPLGESPVTWVKDAVRTGINLASGKQKVPEWYARGIEKTDGYFIRSMERSNVRIVYASDNDERFYPDDRNDYFTELEAFKDCYFVRTTDSLNNGLRKGAEQKTVFSIFKENANWQRIAIVPDWGASCTVILSTKDEEIHLNAKLCRDNRGSNKVFDPQKIFAQYQKLRKQRQADLLAQLEGLRHFFSMSKMFQPESEWCMNKRDWLYYFESNPDMMRTRYDSLQHMGLLENDSLVQVVYNDWVSKVRKLQIGRANRLTQKASKKSVLETTLRLAGFGLYNCDQIVRFASQPSTIETFYYTKNGERIYPYEVRLLEISSSMMLTIPLTEYLYRLPGRQLTVILFDVKGRTYYLSGERFAALKMDNPTRLDLTMQDVSGQTKDAFGWADLLEL